jgi:hypothetical protein
MARRTKHDFQIRILALNFQLRHAQSPKLALRIARRLAKKMKREEVK